MYTQEEQKKYWYDRATKLGETAVGYGDQNIQVQNALYDKRKQFIFKYVSRLAATIDYGCGIGRYTPEFLGNYVGLDMTKVLLDIAQHANPKNSFKLIHGITPIEEDFLALGGKLDQFFTATVLQHCSDSVVSDILERLFNSGQRDFTFYLYENSMPFHKPRVQGRYPEKYHKFIREAGFSIIDWEFYSHDLKGEEHSLIRIRVE